jgi:hypothetical protein
MFMDRSLNHYLNKYLKLYPCWEKPQRWKSWPDECSVERRRHEPIFSRR